jgi:hypothetical protein
MRRIVLAVLMLLPCICRMESRPLKFNDSGKFRIVQFTDVHYIHGDARSDAAIDCINRVLDEEKPDFVIFTGDVIYGKPAEAGYRAVLDLVERRNVPFAVTFGNHDDEQGLSREELLKIIQTYSCSLTSTAEGISGVTNFILPVRSSCGNRDERVLYVLDSHSYSRIDGVGGYDYIKFDQIEWYRENSRLFREANGGEPVPSLAFFHIALPEYNYAASDETAVMFGIRKEKACASKLNSGLFTAMKEMGDVEGVFVGHDHDDDYAVMWHGIMLAYGRYTGGDTVYNNLPNGARVIELTEGEKGFRTWIRTASGGMEQAVEFPGSFLKRKR